ncbi:hypothetical protein H5410_000599, partial [Solanum commersonii]
DLAADFVLEQLDTMIQNRTPEYPGRFCIPLTLEGMGPVTELTEQSSHSSCVQILLKDKNSSLPLKLLFPSDNHLSFPNLKKSESGPSRWLSPRSKYSMLVRFHRGLGIEPARLQEAIVNLRSESAGGCLLNKEIPSWKGGKLLRRNGGRDVHRDKVEHS